jgi:hypothetical protein
MMTTPEAQARIADDPGFVALKRYDYSLDALMDQFPDGCPDKVFAAALLVTEDDVAVLKAQVLEKLRAAMKVNVDGD